MSDEYIHKKIEQKWQKKWEEEQIYHSTVDWNKPKHYALTMLPYPSGDLHIGHWFAMTPSDARARFMRMRGYNVLFPIGFDAFGLPAETAANHRNIHPAKWTYANIERMRKQLKSMGAMFDWAREAVSCDPGYYLWTQWFFKRFFENNVAYRAKALVNWSPSLQTVLASEQVKDGKDDRIGQPVIQKMMTQWFFRITNYAEELLKFSRLDWPEPIKRMQTNWIGRSTGATVFFRTDKDDPIEIFTTRPDTLWGATFLVLAPEHPMLEQLTTPEHQESIKAYRSAAAVRTELERIKEHREKTGVFTGGYVINPVNDKPIPVWVADYVIMSYGTGAIMGVPAHDERDFDFAKQFHLDIIEVIRMPSRSNDDGHQIESYTSKTEGYMINSGELNGTPVSGAIEKATSLLEAKGIGKATINYRMHDWLISRQRYWGAPIPIIYKQDGTFEALPDEALPLLLPNDVQFMPIGPSPLQLHKGFINTTDSKGHQAKREPDTMDTFMCSSWYQYRYLSPNYTKGPFDPEEAAYWLPVDVYTGGAEHATLHLLFTRFYTKAMRDVGVFEQSKKAAQRHGRNVDGLFDEPMVVLRNQGQILGEARSGDFVKATGRWEKDKLLADRVDVIQPSEVSTEIDGVAGEIMHRTENVLHVSGISGMNIVEVIEDAAVNIPHIEGENSVNQLRQHLEIQRMSKSKGNIANPDELVREFGADTVRGYLMHAFDWEKGGPWNSRGILGFNRFLGDVWDISRIDFHPDRIIESATIALSRKQHQTIRKVTSDIEAFAFNTAIAALMTLRKILKEAGLQKSVSKTVWDEAVDTLLLLLAPISPHITEELWMHRGNGYSIHQQPWPVWDEELAKEETITLVVQVNGKVRDRILVETGLGDDELKNIALSSETIQRWLDGKPPNKIIVVRGKLVNIVR